MNANIIENQNIAVIKTNDKKDTEYAINYEFGRDVGSEKYYKITSIQFNYDAADRVVDGADPSYKIKKSSLNVIVTISNAVQGYVGSKQKRMNIALGEIKLNKVSADYQLISCVGNNKKAIIQFQLQDACTSIEGLYDTSTDRCLIPPYNASAPSSTTGVCSSADSTLCTISWRPGDNISDSIPVTNSALINYNNDVYGTGNTGTENFFMGQDAGEVTTSGGRSNTFIGFEAGQSNTTGDNNTFVGGLSGESNSTGGNNTALGSKAGRNSTGSDNVFIGENAGAASSNSGASNVLIGKDAGDDNTTGDENVFIGRGAGFNNTTGDNNIYIGKDARNTPGQRITGDEQMNIGNLLIGEMPANTTGAPNTSELSSNDGLIVNGALVVRRNVKIKEHLEVNHGIQVGITTISCDDSKKGTIRYDSGVNKLKLCSNVTGAYQWDNIAIETTTSGGSTEAQHPVLLR